MKTINMMFRVLAAALLVIGLLAVPAMANSYHPVTVSITPSSVTSIVGSNISKTSNATYTISAYNLSPHGVYRFALVLFGNNRIVSSYTFTNPSSSLVYATVPLTYALPAVGTYTFYGNVSNTTGSITTASVYANGVQGLSAMLSASNPNPNVGQNDAMTLSLTNGFYTLGRSNQEYYTYRVVQIAPDGTTSVIASNPTPTLYNTGSGYQIAVPTLTQSGSYHYDVYVNDPAEGTNATATAVINSHALSTTTAPTTTIPATTTTYTTTVYTTIPTSVSTSTSSIYTTVPTTTVYTTTIPSTPHPLTVAISPASSSSVAGSTIVHSSNVTYTISAYNLTAHGSYTFSLVLVGSPNRVVSTYTFTNPSSSLVYATVPLTYQLPAQGTYSFYGQVSNSTASVNTQSVSGTAFRGLSISLSTTNINVQQGQSASFTIHAINGFISAGLESGPTYYEYSVVQTAPDGSSSTIAVNSSSPGNNNGAIYPNSGYLVSTPTLTESGSYRYTISVRDINDGTNMSVPYFVTVSAGTSTTTVPTTSTTTSTTSTTSVTTTLISICEICSTTVPTTTTIAATTTIPVTTTTNTTTSTVTTTTAVSLPSSNCGGCGVGGGFTGGLPASTSVPTVKTTTIAPTVASTTTISQAKSSSNSIGVLTPPSSSVAPRLKVPSSLTTWLIGIVVLLLAVIMVMLIMVGRKVSANNNSGSANAADDEQEEEQ